VDVDRFWGIIDRAPDEHALRAALEPLSREELAAFAQLLYAFQDRAERQDVWGAGYTLEGEMSDGSFKDFRSWLISRGRAAYEAVLVNPDALADAVPGLVVGDCHLDETYVYTAAELYEIATTRRYRTATTRKPWSRACRPPSECGGSTPSPKRTGKATSSAATRDCSR